MSIKFAHKSKELILVTLLQVLELVSGLAQKPSVKITKSSPITRRVVLNVYFNLQIWIRWNSAVKDAKFTVRNYLEKDGKVGHLPAISFAGSLLSRKSQVEFEKRVFCFQSFWSFVPSLVWFNAGWQTPMHKLPLCMIHTAAGFLSKRLPHSNIQFIRYGIVIATNIKI